MGSATIAKFQTANIAAEMTLTSVATAKILMISLMEHARNPVIFLIAPLVVLTTVLSAADVNKLNSCIMGNAKTVRSITVMLAAQITLTSVATAQPPTPYKTVLVYLIAKSTIAIPAVQATHTNVVIAQMTRYCTEVSA